MRTHWTSLDTRLLDEDAVLQICFVTHDALASAQWFADLTCKAQPDEAHRRVELQDLRGWCDIA